MARANLKTTAGTQRVPAAGSLTVLHQGRSRRYTSDGGPYDVPEDVLERHPDRFEILEDATPTEPTDTGENTPLPEDFPGRDELHAADVTTVEAVTALSDEELDGITGIGPATITRIRAALEG